MLFNSIKFNQVPLSLSLTVLLFQLQVPLSLLLTVFDISASQKDLLSAIAKDGHLSEASDKALNKVVVDFMASFTS